MTALCRYVGRPAETRELRFLKLQLACTSASRIKVPEHVEREQQSLREDN